ncbi:MAG TPA: hypothetical protein VMU35_09005 [Methylomirabilota bacterium]|nr:hypothetical protein [Methylomirabilota bacterium]
MGQPDRLTDFFNDALTVINAAEEKHVKLRLLGATAIYYRCPKSRKLTEAMNRPLTDLDFMTLSKYAEHIPDIFSNLGFEANERVNTLYGLRRQIYNDPKSGRHVDIFVDKLTFCHELDLTRRLEIDPTTLTLADLFLEKMQIVKIGEKDIKDTIILLLEHELGESDDGTLNVKYVAKLLGNDWGWYYTVTTNIEKMKNYVDGLAMLSSDEKQIVKSRISTLSERIEREDKSMKWKFRAKAGPKVKWYADVDDVENIGTTPSE